MQGHINVQNHVNSASEVEKRIAWKLQNRGKGVIISSIRSNGNLNKIYRTEIKPRHIWFKQRITV